MGIEVLRVGVRTRKGVVMGGSAQDGGSAMSVPYSGQVAFDVPDISAGEAQFVDAVGTSFDPSFGRLFGSERIVGYLGSTLLLARRLSKGWYAFDIAFNGVSRRPSESTTLLSVDVASVDQAHLVDSFVAVLDRFGLHPTVTLHPLVTVDRDDAGAIQSANRTGTKDVSGRLESYIHFDVFASLSTLDVAALREDFDEVFRALASVHEDLGHLTSSFSPKLWGIGESSGAKDLLTPLGTLRWIDGNVDPNSTTGVLRNLDSDDLAQLGDSFTRGGLGVHLASVVSPVISNEALIVGPCDPIGEGDLLVGLPSRRMVTHGPHSRELLMKLSELLSIPEESYSYRELDEILDMVPDIEISLAPIGVFHDGISSLLLARETNQIASYISSLTFDDVLRIYLYIPTIRYRTGMDHAIEANLTQALRDLRVFAKESKIDAKSARIDVDIIAAPGSTIIDPTQYLRLVESVAQTEAKTWFDRLEDELSKQYDKQYGIDLCTRYQDTFDATYQNDYSPLVGSQDTSRIESALQTGGTWVGFTSELERTPLIRVPDNSFACRLRIINLGAKQKLSSLLPLIETFGLSVVEEIPYQLVAPDGRPVWLYDLGVELKSPIAPIENDVLVQFSKTFSEVFLGELDADLVNSLVLSVGLDTHGVVFLRTLAYYQRFLKSGSSVSLALDTLALYPSVSRALTELFEAKFNAQVDLAMVDIRREYLLHLVDKVEKLEHDQFFRMLIRVVEAVLRTNLYVRDQAGDAVAIKLNSKEVPGLGEPVPAVETFVFSPLVEGIHLRSSLVARGGIRYSDRKDDYRLEILSLMKAQAVKNAVIVPNGAKGGFVVRGLAADEVTVKKCYDTFISALLSITDNIVDGSVSHPEIGPIYDGDDPYLVVAADKGTATFSDRANALAGVRKFWLGDAFASGGSSGYDHKEMGITAKGAWTSVRHHFARLGIDPEVDPIYTVGIGDMSGDVFGNGMLLSRTLHLIAAFDHRDIFIDPDPDPDVSFDERLRLFVLPHSSWKDYSSGLISQGGAVYSRSLKAIELSSEASAALGAEAGSYSPTELIRTILAARVDLIWNGGIGTYIRATSESNAEIGDKTNDQLRVAADSIRAKVIGEGGNLGLSQLARVELSRNGVLVNTDAIDNSAGVDTSDHEVNLKILYQHAASLADQDRAKLLNSLTGEVEKLVLADNLWQNWTLSMASSEFDEMRGAYVEFVSMLERDAGLDRGVEFIPSDTEMLAGYTLSRPELSVLLGYEKLRVKSVLGSAGIEQIPLLSGASISYFPDQLRESIKSEVSTHPLWCQLVANFVANRVLNVAGPTYFMRSTEESGLSLVEVAKCFIEADQIFGTSEVLWAIMTDRNLEFSDLLKGFVATVRCHERVTRWLMRDAARNIAIELDYYRSTTQKLMANFPEVLSFRYFDRYQSESSRLAQFSQSDDILAMARLASFATSLMEIAHLALDFKDHEVFELAKSYFAVGEALAMPELLESARHLPRRSSWDRQVRISVRDDLDSVHVQAFCRIMSERDGGARERRLELYSDFGAGMIRQWIKAADSTMVGRVLLDSDRLAMLVVATRKLRAMVENS